MTPKIAFHGGECCGIKIIHSLGDNPDLIAEGIDEESRSEKEANPDQYGRSVSSSLNMYNYDAPEETVLARIDRYIGFIRAERPQGIVEIVLAQSEPDEDGDCCPDQVNVWHDILVGGRGFREVTSCHNSNSGNRVHVYHLVMDKE